MNKPADANELYTAQISAENERLRRELATLRVGATNRDFVQVSRKYLDALDTLAGKSLTARKLLTTLVKAMDRQNAVMVSHESLAKLTGSSVATIKRALTVLRDERWIEVLKVGTANVYRVNSSVFWRSHAGGKWASFSAQVLVNFDEQDAKTKATPQPKLRHVQFLDAGDEAIVSETALGNEDPPEQAQIDYHRREE